MLEPLRPLHPYLFRYKKRYLIGFAALLVTQILGVSLPLVVRSGVDSLIETLNRDRLFFFTGLLLGVALVKVVFQFWMRWILIGISREVEYDLRNDLFCHLTSLSLTYYNQNRIGDLMSKATNDLHAVRMMIGPGIMYAANTLVIGLGAITLMLSLDWLLALFVLLPLPVVSILVKHFGKKIHDRFESIQALYSSLSEKVRENVVGVRVLRAYRQEEAQKTEFGKLNRKLVLVNKQLITIWSFLYPGLALLSGISFGLVLMVGGFHVLSGRITIGTFMAFHVYLMVLIWPMIALGWVSNLFQRGIASLNRIDSIFQAQPDIIDRDMDMEKGMRGNFKAKRLEGSIEFRNLSFSYNGKVVLKDINLKIESGQTIAIVGATGSGKSTLVNLLPRIYDPPPGSVLIDGVSVQKIPLAFLRSQIGFVPQEPFLFSQTIRNNIAFGVGEASEDQVEQAAKISQILSDIQMFPRGMKTMVGERGITLSGGQKQRTSIARAILYDPPILVLDDSLSSVDTFTEEKILRHLREVMRKKTTLLISHRVSTVQHADQIVVLDEGSIVERGTHSELLGENGIYMNLYNKQIIEEEIEKT